MKKILITSVLFAFAIAAKAQAPDPDTTAKHFLIMASIGNLQEVNAGKLAVQKTAKPDVKMFGQMMIDDHGKAESQLLQLAKSQHIILPVEATMMPPFDLNLSKAPGDDFDRMYIHSMVSGHRANVGMFEKYATTGKNPQVRAFAQQMLPTLKQHLAAIKALDEKYNYLVAK